MNKIILKSFIIFLLSIANCLSDIINKIQIDGNKRISNETILVLGDITAGSDFNNDQLNRSLKNLYNSNFFKDVELTFDNNILKIIVIENPIIEDIEFTGIKSNALLEKLNEVMNLKNRMSFSNDLVKRDVDLIKNVLKANGFYFAKVETSISRNQNLNSVRLKINIDQGKKAKIKNITFLGDKKIKDKKLREIIASEEHKFWKFVSNKVYLNAQLIELDKRLLKNFYKNQGFYNVKILNSFAELDKDGFFKLVYNIDSGKKFYFNNFNLDLPTDYKEKDFVKIQKIFKKLRNQEYSLDSINLILEEVDNIASLQLYDFINAEVEETFIANNKIDFNFKIKDSEKFYVERINIVGNFNTIEEVIRHNLIVDEGDPLNKILFNKSINQLKSLGIFKKVESEISDGSSGNTKVVNIKVEEQPTGEISLGAGVGTSGSTLGGGLKEKNFLGKGINLDTNFEISEESIKGKFVYARPNFNYSDNTLFTSLESSTTDNLSDFGYKVSNVGFSLGTSFEQYENLFFKPEIDLNVEDLKTNSNASQNLKKQKGTYEDIYVNYSLTYDMRDSYYRPSKGHRTNFYQTIPMVSDNGEVANIFTHSRYKPLSSSKDMVGKASLYVKAVNSINGSDVRISKRGNVPYSRLRGFEKGKIGPIENGDYIGGNYVSAVNLSTNLPFIFSTVENIDFSYFIDAANVWGVDYDSSIDDSGTLRSSTGLGIDLLTPVGPLSFSFTQPISKASSDKTETFRFNLGTTF